MTKRRHQVVREVGSGKYIAHDATWARPEVSRAFDKARKDERAESRRLREALQRERADAA